MRGCPSELVLFEDRVTEFFKKMGCLLTTDLTYTTGLCLQSSSYLEELRNSGSEKMVS